MKQCLFCLFEFILGSFPSMYRAWRAGCVLFLAAFCYSKVPVKIKSVYNNRYLDTSGSFVQKKKVEGQMYAKVEKDTGGEKRFRVENGSGKALVVTKDKGVSWVPKSDVEMLTIAEEKDGEAYLKTKDGHCLRRSSKDKVETGECPKTRKDKDGENYLFRVTFGAGKGKKKEKEALKQSRNASEKSSRESACSKCRIPAPCAEACSNPPSVEVPAGCGVASSCGGGCDDCSAGEETIEIPVKVGVPGPCGKAVTREPCACLKESGLSRLVGGPERRRVSFFTKKDPVVLSTDALASFFETKDAEKNSSASPKSSSATLEEISKGLGKISSKIPDLNRKDEKNVDPKSLAQRAQDFAAGKVEGMNSALMSKIQVLVHTLKTTAEKLEALVGAKDTKGSTEKSAEKDGGVEEIVSVIEPAPVRLAKGLFGKL